MVYMYLHGAILALYWNVWEVMRRRWNETVNPIYTVDVSAKPHENTMPFPFLTQHINWNWEDNLEISVRFFRPLDRQLGSLPR